MEMSQNQTLREELILRTITVTHRFTHCVNSHYGKSVIFIFMWTKMWGVFLLIYRNCKTDTNIRSETLILYKCTYVSQMACCSNIASGHACFGAVICIPIYFLSCSIYFKISFFFSFCTSCTHLSQNIKTYAIYNGLSNNMHFTEQKECFVLNLHKLS